jgi:hypothetical protein
MKKIISLSVFVVLIFFSQISCNKDSSDNDPGYCGNAWTTQLSDETAALSNAATVYATDPTIENCNAYKAAYQNYLDALEPFTDCAGYTAAQKNDLENAIAQAQADINNLCI